MGKYRIMVIDNEEGFAETVKVNLEEQGLYEVKVETRGSRALDSIREFRPHMVFLDIIMPDLDGVEIDRQMRRSIDLAGIPVVFLTALVRDAEVNVALAGGQRSYMSKPVTTQQLVECINRILKLKE